MLEFTLRLELDRYRDVTASDKSAPAVLNHAPPAAPLAAAPEHSGPLEHVFDASDAALETLHLQLAAAVSPFERHLLRKAEDFDGVAAHMRRVLHTVSSITAAKRARAEGVARVVRAVMRGVAPRFAARAAAALNVPAMQARYADTNLFVAAAPSVPPAASSVPSMPSAAQRRFAAECASVHIAAAHVFLAMESLPMPTSDNSNVGPSLDERKADVLAVSAGAALHHLTPYQSSRLSRLRPLGRLLVTIAATLRFGHAAFSEWSTRRGSLAFLSAISGEVSADQRAAVISAADGLLSLLRHGYNSLLRRPIHEYLVSAGRGDSVLPDCAVAPRHSTVDVDVDMLSQHRQLVQTCVRAIDRRVIERCLQVPAGSSSVSTVSRLSPVDALMQDANSVLCSVRELGDPMAVLSYFRHVATVLGGSRYTSTIGQSATSSMTAAMLAARTELVPAPAYSLPSPAMEHRPGLATALRHPAGKALQAALADLSLHPLLALAVQRRIYQLAAIVQVAPVSPTDDTDDG
jgi:hypothetical protein